MSKKTMTITDEDIKIRKIQPPISKIMKDKKKYDRKEKHKQPYGAVIFFTKKKALSGLKFLSSS